MLTHYAHKILKEFSNQFFDIYYFYLFNLIKNIITTRRKTEEEV